MGKFLGQGLNPRHSSDPNHSSDNTRSWIHCTTRELPPNFLKPMFKNVHRMNNLKIPLNVLLFLLNLHLAYQFKDSKPTGPSFIPSLFYIFLSNSSSPHTWQKGAHSATMTWNFLFRAASLRKASTVREKPMVMITSLEWMCSRAWAAMFSVVPSARSQFCKENIWDCLATTWTDMTEHRDVCPSQNSHRADPGNTRSMDLIRNVTLS